MYLGVRNDQDVTILVSHIQQGPLLIGYVADDTRKFWSLDG